MYHNFFVKRCIELALKGNPSAFPNPLVGAILVYENKIVAEGYHEKYGENHAEINCIANLKDKTLLSKCTLYVSLEPCSHYGKTPPCANAIVETGIKKVVIGCRDFTSKVNGKGIEILKNNNIEIIENVLEKECIHLNKKFFDIHKKQRPYIILKWAQSKDEYIGKINEEIIISNPLAQQLNHKWRSEEMAILIGYNTALIDNPRLNCRLINGKNPVRIVIDDNLNLPENLNLFDNIQSTFVFNKIKDDLKENTIFIKYENEASLLKELYLNNIHSIIIEGGAKTIEKFISNNMWDEARIITSNKNLNDGVEAPKINSSFMIEKKIELKDNNITYYKNQLQQ